MNHHLNRRLFLKRAVVTAGALSAARFLPGPNLLQAASPGDKLSWVQIGCGGRGTTRSPRRWAIRGIAWKATIVFANTSGRGRSAKSPKLIVGLTALMAASALVLLSSRSPLECIGSNGSGRLATGITMMTCSRTNGMAGTISATALLAIWA